MTREEDIKKALRELHNRNYEESTEHEEPEEQGQVESPFRVIEPFIEEAHRIAQEYDLPWPTKNPFENLPQLPAKRHVEHQEKKQKPSPPTEPVITCPNPDCQAANYLSSNYCRRCGAPLKEETQQEWTRKEDGWAQQPQRDSHWQKRRHSPSPLEK